MIQVSTLVESQAARREQISTRVLSLARRDLARFDGWYDDRLVREVSEQVSAYVTSGQRQVANLTDAYLSRVLAEMLGEYVTPVGVIDLSTPQRQGLSSLADAYERLGAEFRYNASLAASPDAGMAAMLNRLDAMVLTDMALAVRKQAQKTLARREVDGYRRIIRPYASTGGTCGLCVVASDRQYEKSALLPIHDRCKCEVLPIVGGDDPGISLNDDDLGRLYAHAGGKGGESTTSGAALKNVRVRYEEHGELGPVMTDMNHRAKSKRL